MDLYLQMGHGMQSLAKEFISQWNGGNLIISPVNIKQTQLIKYAKEIKLLGGKLLFDPQLFTPRDAHSKLQEYDYWPSGTISNGDILNNIDKELLRLNEQINTEHLILPGTLIKETNFANVYNQITFHSKFFRDKTNKKLLATLCFSSESLRNHSFIEQSLSYFKLLDVDGFYVIPEPIKGCYINSDALWEMGLLKLITCLKLLNKIVILGYAHHQSLIASLAKVDAICSGTYMNTRAFNQEKFQSYKDDDIKHRSTWYYLPDAFSEYKATLLDIANQRNFLSELFLPANELTNKYSSMLFSGAIPSSTNYNETNSFKHYLFCLKKQCELLTANNYDDVYNRYEFMLNAADCKIKKLKAKGIRGQNRDFEPGLEVNRIAMCALNEDYGMKLKFEWNNI